MKIHQLKLRLSNAYLLIGDCPVLVDTGSPGETASIRAQLRNLKVELSDLSLIAHTHVHSDHIGSTLEIAAEADCPVAYHPADQSIADQKNNGPLKGIGIRGKIMARVFSHAAFDPVVCDLPLRNGTKLNKYGVDATVLETPGHTAGSVSFFTPDGDAIIGDVLMGGMMGGAFLPSKPNFHYFADDVDLAMESVDRILSQSSRQLFVGHGGPLAHQAVRKWRERQLN